MQNTSTFISCFKRFVSRHGCPSTVISDNGSAAFISDDTQNFVSSRLKNLKFNLDKAPWWGGMWERRVASVNRCIVKIVGIRRIAYIELQTLIFEIEVILNNRPIGVDSDDDVEDVLMRNQLVTMM